MGLRGLLLVVPGQAASYRGSRAHSPVAAMIAGDRQIRHLAEQGRPRHRRFYQVHAREGDRSAACWAHKIVIKPNPVGDDPGVGRTAQAASAPSDGQARIARRACRSRTPAWQRLGAAIPRRSWPHPPLTDDVVVLRPRTRRSTTPPPPSRRVRRVPAAAPLPSSPRPVPGLPARDRRGLARGTSIVAFKLVDRRAVADNDDGLTSVRATFTISSRRSAPLLHHRAAEVGLLNGARTKFEDRYAAADRPRETARGLSAALAGAPRVAGSRAAPAAST